MACTCLTCNQELSVCGDPCNYCQTTYTEAIPPCAEPCLTGCEIDVWTDCVFTSEALDFCSTSSPVGTNLTVVLQNIITLLGCDNTGNGCGLACLSIDINSETTALTEDYEMPFDAPESSTIPTIKIDYFIPETACKNGAENITVEIEVKLPTWTAGVETWTAYGTKTTVLDVTGSGNFASAIATLSFVDIRDFLIGKPLNVADGYHYDGFKYQSSGNYTLINTGIDDAGTLHIKDLAGAILKFTATITDGCTNESVSTQEIIMPKRFEYRTLFGVDVSQGVDLRAGVNDGIDNCASGAMVAAYYPITLTDLDAYNTATCGAPGPGALFCNTCTLDYSTVVLSAYDYELSLLMLNGGTDFVTTSKQFQREGQSPAPNVSLSEILDHLRTLTSLVPSVDNTDLNNSYYKAFNDYGSPYFTNGNYSNVLMFAIGREFVASDRVLCSWKLNVYNTATLGSPVDCFYTEGGTTSLDLAGPAGTWSGGQQNLNVHPFAYEFCY